MNKTNLQQTDTIVGMATAVGKAGVNVIRMSGITALSNIQKIFYSSKNSPIKSHQIESHQIESHQIKPHQIKSHQIKPHQIKPHQIKPHQIKPHQIKSHRFYHGWIKHQGEWIDEVLVVFMKAPRSYTKEDVVEIHSHGNILIANRMLKILLSLGVKLAERGEFTKRAFLNGRIDLTKAEAIGQLVQAKSLASLSQAVNQLQGKLFDKISSFREKIAWVLSLINAQIDFIEEDVFFTHLKQVEKDLQKINKELITLIDTAEQGKIIQEGVRLVLLGAVNVGKSSLMNALLKEERSIVTSTAGTTRDFIEESISIQNILFYLTDTAGIRTANSLIEKLGIERSYQIAQKADAILWVVDSSKPDFSINFQKLPANIPILLVCNKTDLRKIDKAEIPKEYQIFPCVSVSALQKNNCQKNTIPKLETAIYQLIFDKDFSHQSLMLTNQRQKQAAIETQKSIHSALQILKKKASEEIIAEDLKNALYSLGLIVGETTTEDLLDNIFSNFCIGK